MTILIVQADRTATADEWSNLHRMLGDHRAHMHALGQPVDTSASFPTPEAFAPVVQEQAQLPTITAPAAQPQLSDLLGSNKLANPVSAPAAPVKPTEDQVMAVVKARDESGDAACLADYMATHNAFPGTSTDDEKSWINEHWQDLLADEHVKAQLKGSPYEDTYKAFRQVVNAARTRWIKQVRNGNGAFAAAAQNVAPATERMSSLSQLLGQAPAAPAPASNESTKMTADAAKQLAEEVTVPTQLTVEQQTSIRAHAENLTPTRQALIHAWLAGDINPGTGRPVTVDDLKAGDSGAPNKLRTMVAKAIRDV